MGRTERVNGADTDSDSTSSMNEEREILQDKLEM